MTALRAVELEMYTIRPDIVASMPSWQRPDDVLVPGVIFVNGLDVPLIDAALAGEAASVMVINQATEEVVRVVREADGVLVRALDDITTALLARKRAEAVSS